MSLGVTDEVLAELKAWEEWQDGAEDRERQERADVRDAFVEMLRELGDDEQQWYLASVALMLRPGAP